MASTVTFVVPCYNYGRYVKQAVDSLLAQTHRDLDVIVIDDASTDETPRVLRAYAGEPRVRVIRHDVNIGHVRSYNEGLGQATGTYIGLLSADDFAASPESVARQVAMFEAHPDVGFVFGRQQLVHPDGSLREVLLPNGREGARAGVDEFTSLMRINYVPHSGTLVRRACHDAVGLYDATLPHACDWDMWLRLCTRFDAGYIDAPLYAYRIHAVNMSHRTVSPGQGLSEVLRTLDGNFELLEPAVRTSVAAVWSDARRQAAFLTLWGDLAHGRTRRSWQGLGAIAMRVPTALGRRAYYGAVVRAAALSVFGSRRYLRWFGGFAE